MVDSNSERQERAEQLVEQGHSRAHAAGVAWAEQTPGFTPPPEHGVDEPGVIK